MDPFNFHTLEPRQDVLNSSILNNQTGTARAVQGQSIGSFFASLIGGVTIASVQLLLWLYLKEKLPNLYQPKTFLVPERERTKPLPPGPWQWLKPIFRRADEEFLQKCGLDAFFLCRYLLVLLRIFVPLGLVIFPILVPLNATGGNNIVANVQGTGRNVTKGLDVITISNIQPKLAQRLWAHCLLAVVVIIWTCYVMFTELRNFIRVRQAYLTSPQHRLRASASTVLVRAVPNKYIDRDELDRLFDVFPGGIRNVWVNRDYSTLTKLIKRRQALAELLEGAETELIHKCWAAWEKGKSSRIKTGQDPSTSQIDGANDVDDKGNDLSQGISANNPHQVHHNVDDAVEEMDKSDALEEVEDTGKPRLLGRGLQAMQHGFQNIGRGFNKIGKGIRGNSMDNNQNLAADSGFDDGRPRRFQSVRKMFGKESGSAGTDVELQENHADTASFERTRTANGLDGDSGEIASRKVVSADSGQDSTDLTREKTANMPYDPIYDEDKNMDARWRKYIEEDDRPTMRIADKLTWLPKLVNPRAQKVDTIWYCRKELAKLNMVIEEEQQPENEENFPKMKSAFIQFNNQAAAHMACQSVAHHIPKFMTPRVVEIAPNDIIWKNMSIPWWSRYLRTGGILVLVCGAVILWAVPVAFLSSLSQLDALRKTVSWLHWLQSWPGLVISIIQGILPVILIALLIFLLGLLLRAFVRYQGAPTNMEVELTVQKYFFAFAFVQYFLVVSISSALTVLIGYIQELLKKGSFEISSIPQVLAQNVPIASNYFLSNILLQSLSQSAGGILQLFPRLTIYALSNGTKKLAREKFSARTNLRTMDWGTTYPLYTTLACIALIYSVIAPMILPLTIFGFGVWWISTRYQMLYVFRYTVDTGGLLFPEAIKQLFTGLYVLELVLIGYFIIVTTGTSTNKIANDGANTPKLIPLVVIMAAAMACTLVFQFLLRNAFDPLLKYIPISLEDNAVERDEEFERLLEMRHKPEDETNLMSGAAEGEIRGQRNDEDEETGNWIVPESDLEAGKLAPTNNSSTLRASNLQRLDPEADRQEKSKSWAERSRRRSARYSRSPSYQGTPGSTPAAELTQFSLTQAVDESSVIPARGERQKEEVREPAEFRKRLPLNVGLDGNFAREVQGVLTRPLDFVLPPEQAIQAQESARAKEAYKLYGNIPDDLEALTVSQRDTLVNRAFRHSALRAKRPCIWIPRDKLGVADDEVRNTARFTSWIWISDENQIINENGKYEYTGPPPDLDEVDLIQL